MKRTDQIQGQRLPDLDFRENFTMRQDPPGAFRKVTGFPDSAVAYPSNLTGMLWLAKTPNGLHVALGAHTVREEDDGTISVKPGDGSSNSILVSNGKESWHGYITKGLWWELT